MSRFGLDVDGRTRKASVDVASASMLRQRQFRQHFRAEINEHLVNVLSPRGVDLWWITTRTRLAGLTANELLDLGCFETIKLELFRLTGRLDIVAESER